MCTLSEVTINSCFEKKFTFEKKKEWILPSNVSIYRDDVWIVKTINELKTELNDIKSLLNDKGESWLQHTCKINKAGFVMDYIKSRIQPEILTQAWCKFYEILSTFSVVPEDVRNFSSTHLCEAPGAFISALNYYLYLHHPDILVGRIFLLCAIINILLINSINCTLI